ncbi:uncharacterized protein DEA37_0013901 [Paragonimus westermani]|uniref:MYND-type domain-containing protein n=1 Tax=Paragonimus westermani TaxID=34504 RepID=A0A5J4N9F6_9TREM|nr:uncharacterized protein DEA37_0013901 [Paragonimus westermani]
MRISEFHEAVTRGDFEQVKLQLSTDRTLINCRKDGLTPLHQACFHGHIDIVEYLLKNGADINARDTNQGYTTLMFAAIRGNHRVTTLINNFLEKAEVDYYTQSSVPTRLRLTSHLADGLYSLISCPNVTPVKIFLLLDPDPKNVTIVSSLLDHCTLVVNVLDDLLDKFFNPHQTHEALALKFHLLACCLRKVREYLTSDAQPRVGGESGIEKRDSQLTIAPRLLSLIRIFLRGGDPHGLPIGQEKFLRQTLLSFPHHESTLWKHVVNQVSGVQPGYSPTSLSVIDQAIKGQGPTVMVFGDEPSYYCTTCGDGQPVKIMLCRECKEVGYCSVTCQRLHWFTHKKFCRILKGKCCW